MNILAYPPVLALLSICLMFAGIESIRAGYRHTSLAAACCGVVVFCLGLANGAEAIVGLVK